MEDDKIKGLKKYWTTIGGEMICSVKRLCRYMEMKPDEDWTQFGYVGWDNTKYSNEELLAFVKSPNFITIFQHYLEISSELMKENEEYKERDAKRRKIVKDDEKKKREERDALLAQTTPGERIMQLEAMKLPDLKKLYHKLSGSGNKAAVVQRIVDYEMEKNKLKAV